MMHGIDPEHYKKAVPSEEFGETGEEIFNLITLWRDTLPVDADGNFKITNLQNMAVAIAYIAMTEGVEAPTPIGLFDASLAVVKL